MENRGAEELRTYEEINRRIQSGDVVVMTATEFIEYVESYGLEKASKDVDVVTTGTFGAMCSSGAFLNFGHADPPIKMVRCWLNDVPAYAGIAAVDCYIGASCMSETRPFEYGGGHVIEDLVSGKEVELRAEGRVTDCYPRESLETTITLNDINQAMLVNPRNAYERYNAAINSSNRTLYTYLGVLLPNYGNIHYCGAGELSPLYKDMNFETIGIGTRIFLGGGIGYIIGEGTQHNPQNQLGTISVCGNLKQMSSEYLRGATFYRYSTTLYVGVGIPIPIINKRVAATAALKDSEIFTYIIDFGVPSRNRPIVKKVSYAELKSGKVEINNMEVRASPLSSFQYAAKIANTLKEWIEKGKFLLSRPVELIPNYREFKPLIIKKREFVVKDVMTREIVVGRLSDSIKDVARLLTERGIDHLPIVDDENRLIGIVTSWDLAKAIAQDKKDLESIMTKRVITAKENDLIDIVVKRMAEYKISGVPVVDEKNHVIGILTTDDISRKLVGRRLL
ncbi:MAG: homocysteine biosynthesis protein [Nitrososphaerales archaeon]|nr:homocysteine biosynthesis protein [Nitrososphaerales archaeon]